MNDKDCTDFLQWALPQINLRWAGFRRVRHQVCKRLQRRMNDLGLADPAAYRARIAEDPAEWRIVDEACHITISRFFRDRKVFEVLMACVLPDIAARAREEKRDARIWSAGCASGEEAYTLKILWDRKIARLYPGVRLSLVATDVDTIMLARAREACFDATSLHELPPHLLTAAFDQRGGLYCLRPQYREGIEFQQRDLRVDAPPGLFDMILCRYVAFTYFAQSLQKEVLARVLARLLPNGYLVIGTHEQLPTVEVPLAPIEGAPQIYKKRVDTE